MKVEMWIFAGREYPRTFTILPTAHCLRKGSQGDGSMMGDRHLLGHLRWGKGRDEVSQAVAGWGEVGSTQEATDGSTGVCSASPEQQKPPPRASPAGGLAQEEAANPSPATLSPTGLAPRPGLLPKPAPLLRTLSLTSGPCHAQTGDQGPES